MSQVKILVKKKYQDHPNVFFLEDEYTQFVKISNYIFHISVFTNK